MIPVGLAGLGVVIIAAETAAQTSLQVAASGHGWVWLAGGVAAYVIAALIYYLILQGGAKLGIVNAMWSAGTGITVAMVGLYVFKQNLAPTQWVGIAMAVAGSILLASGGPIKSS